MPLREFQDARARIGRAETHRKAFADVWNGFIEDEPYSAVLNMEDNGTGELHVRCYYETLPEVLWFEFGEMLYQLRAALDSCIYGAAILESGQNPPPDEKNLEFPICFSSGDFKKARWHIRPLRNNARLMQIIESVQPYNVVKDLRHDLLVLSPHRSIGMLHDWARKDRHRKLNFVGSWASNANPHLILPDGCELEHMLVTHDGLLENDSLIARFELSGYVPGMNVQGNPDLAIDVAVDEPPYPAADNDTLNERMRWLIPYLKDLVRAVEDCFVHPVGEAEQGANPAFTSPIE